MQIKLPTLHCKRCGHRWVPRSSARMCPHCKSVHWQTKRTTRQGLRPFLADDENVKAMRETARIIGLTALLVEAQSTNARATRALIRRALALLGKEVG